MSNSSSLISALGVTGEDTQFLSLTGKTHDEISAKAALDNINSFSLYTSRICEVNCKQAIQDVTIIIAPGAQTGDVSFSQECTVQNVNCALGSLVDSSVESSLKDIQNSINSGTFNYDSSIYHNINSQMGKTTLPLNVVLKNNMLELISSHCTFETNQKIENDYVYVGTDASVGDISFAQRSNLSNIDCAIDVIGKSSSYKTEIHGDNTPKNNIFVSFGILIIMLIFMSIIMVIVFLVSGGDKQIRSLLGFSNDPPPLDQKYYDLADRNVRIRNSFGGINSII